MKNIPIYWGKQSLGIPDLMLSPCLDMQTERRQAEDLLDTKDQFLFYKL